MSIYEALAVLTLAAAGGYAYFLYRKDTRPLPPGQERERPVSRPMFSRTPPKDD